MQDNSLKTMIFGIIAIAAGGSGLLGIIFGALALSEAKKYAAAHDGVVDGKAKVGKILGTIGLIFGIIALVCYLISGIVYGCTIAMGAAGGALDSLLN